MPETAAGRRIRAAKDPTELAAVVADMLAEARALGRAEALSEAAERVRTWNGNGYDEPREPMLDAVYELLISMKKAVPHA